MCGITGYYQFKGNKKIRIGDLKKASDTIEHRGPDDSGLYEKDNIGLAHRRLSIIDLSPTGHQPMISPCERFVIIFNGEIYNYQDLKIELQHIGYRFKGTSDTETILYGFLHFGKSYLSRLNGIFALAIWDNKTEELTLARDRMGVKPLYYYMQDDLILFGSEIKTILSYNFVQRKVNPQGFHEFLYYGYSLGENTLFKNIKKLLPGNALTITRQDINFDTFWEIEKSSILESSGKEKEIIEKTKNLLENAVKRQLISDVPIGIFLSGGIDSSAILAFASKHYDKKIKTYTAGFDFNENHNELPIAAKTAKQFGANHHELLIKGGDISSVIEKLIYHHDEPFSDAANIPLYLLTKHLDGTPKVILQGDGGDELFGGYARYQIIKNRNLYCHAAKMFEAIKFLLPDTAFKRKASKFSSLFREKQLYRFMGKFLTSESDTYNSPYKSLSNEVNAFINETNPFIQYKNTLNRFDFLSDEVQQLLWTDTQIILPNQFLEKVDKSTMANGIEVRVPFLDNDLVDFAVGLPSKLKLKNGVKKYLLKKSLEGILPNELLYGKKMGFGVPYDNWLKAPLKDYMISVFQSKKIQQQPIFDMTIINKKITEHCEGRENHGFFLWKMMNFCLWLDMYDVEF